MIKRNDNIDFFRGVAAVWIIFIHTCFWSGSSYVPTWLQSLSLIIDVPLFVFISGMTFNFSNNFFKTIKSLCKIWFKWLEFLIIYFLIILLFDFDHFNLSSIIRAIFFNFSGNDMLIVVNGSLWFIFMFFVVCLIGNLIICIYNKYFDNLNNFKYILFLIFLLYGMSLYNNSFIFLSTVNLMYIFVYLLGYYLYHFHFKNFKYFLISLVIVVFFVRILLHFNEYGFLNMQAAKNIAHINYFAYSLISILCVVFLKDKIYVKNNVFTFIGRNALIFYFCQGIGSSLIYKIYPYIIDFPSIMKLLFMFGSNFCITCLFAVILILGSKKIKIVLNYFCLRYLKHRENDRKMTKKML